MKYTKYDTALFKSLAKTNQIAASEDFVVVKDLTGGITVRDDRTVSFVITNNTVDRSGDRVFPQGVDFTNYRANPVVLWGHDADSFPIGKCLGDPVLRDGSWVATVEFVPFDCPVVGPVSEAAYKLLKDGYLSAVSIGFRPMEYVFNDSDGIDYQMIELLEFSVVTIPCNPTALAVAPVPVAMPEAVSLSEPIAAAKKFSQSNKRYLDYINL